jgi:putative toxin-antitoxin system antitoxin component (TIGR02293 family)
LWVGKTYKSTRKVKSYDTMDKDNYVSIIEEPIHQAYVLQSPFYAILNISSNLHNEMDLVNLSRKGILKQAVTNMAFKLGITQEKICEILHMSARNFQRIKDNAPLDIYTSEQTIEMASVYAKAHKIFSNEESIKQWFQAPNYALGNQKPLDLLDTSFGVKMVTDVLGRIEHGVFS